MDVSLLVRGLALGFAIAAPVGPIGALCIRRTLVYGWRIGFVSGLGAATADGFYGAVAAFGLTAISTLLTSGQLWLRLVGGLFLCYLGVRGFLAKPATPTAAQSDTAVKPVTPTDAQAQNTVKPATRGGLAAYASTVGLTLTNPTTILSFAAVFAGLGVGSASRSYLGAALLVAGVALGSASWWLILSTTVNALRSRFRADLVGWVGRASSVVLLVFGLVALVSIVSLIR